MFKQKPETIYVIYTIHMITYVPLASKEDVQLQLSDVVEVNMIHVYYPTANSHDDPGSHRGCFRLVSSFEIGDFQGQQVSLPEGNHSYMINHDY